MAQKVRIAIIGCGMIAQTKHIPALKYHADRCEIAAFSDIDLLLARKLASEHGCAGAYGTDDYKIILADPSIDAVHICTPNATHCDISVAAMNAGKHVLCEKPMAHTSEAAKLMMDTAERTGKKLTISYQYRFRSDSQAVHAYCANGDLGEIYFAKAHALRRRGVPTWGVFTQKKAQGGGPLVDIGTHSLDLALWHMNNYDVDYVSGMAYQKLKDHPEGNIGGPWIPEKYEVEDSAFGFIKMKNGAAIFLESSWALNTLEVKEGVTTLCGTLGGAAQHMVKPGRFSYTINTIKYGDMVTIAPDDPEKYSPRGAKSANELMVEAPRAEMDQWLDAIINDHDPVVLPYQCYTVSRILEAIYISSETGKPVYF